MPYSHPQPIDRQTALRRIPHLAPGAFAFAGIAGFINSVVLGFFRTPVSHMSGAVSHLGVLVGARKLLPGRSYAVALILEGLLLAGSILLLATGHRLGLPLVAAACGLQNAMTSSCCGLMIRSTHVTGIVTDIGVMIGHWLRHRRVERWKLYFLCTVCGAFGTGGWLGAVIDLHHGPASLALPAAGCVAAGIFVWISAGRGHFDLTQYLPDSLPRTAAFPSA